MKIARAMFTFALHREIVDFNPFAQISVAIPAIKAKSRKRALSEEEIVHLWSSLSKQSDPRSLPTRRALLAILITLQRPQEVTGMTRKEIEEEWTGWWWTIPWDRIKTRNESDDDHRVFLSTLALELINSGAPENAVFANSNGQPIARHALSHYVSDHNSFGIPKWTPHDLRRSAAT